MPSWHFLINSGPVPSYHHTVNGTHTIPIPPWEPCCTHMILSPFLHPDNLMPWLCSPFLIVISHISCFSPTHNFHLKYNSSHMMLCSDPNPALTYYIHFHIITLTSPLSPTSHPHSHQHCCALFSSIKSHLHVCIRHVQISTCVTIAYLTHQLLDTLVLKSDLQTLALCSTLCSSPSGSWTSDLTLNTKHQHTMSLTGPQTSTLSPHKILGPQ